MGIIIFFGFGAFIIILGLVYSSVVFHHYYVEYKAGRQAGKK